MKFDDRLATVINQPARDSRDRAVRWRQLVDLLAHSDHRADRMLVDQAYHLAATEMPSIDPAVRAAAARQLAAPDVPARLIALFATDEASIAAPMLAAADIGARGWAMVDSRASDSVRAFLAALGRRPGGDDDWSNGTWSDDGRPSDDQTTRPPATGDRVMPSISDVIARIEKLRAERERSHPTAAATRVEAGPESTPPPPSDGGEGLLEHAALGPLLDPLFDPLFDPPAETLLDADPLADPAPLAEPTPLADPDPLFDPPAETLFDADPLAEPALLADPAPLADPALLAEPALLFAWEADTNGRIDWVEGAPRGALIGRSLADERTHGDIREALLARAPFADSLLVERDGPLTGEWQWSGTPAFSRGEGRFVGFRGTARRTDAPVAAPDRPGPSRRADADGLREMIHEIRTPLNAIIGFAEIIDGQYLGPAHRRYRERAADIVVQARELLAALGDVDLAAQLQSDRAAPGEGTDLAELFPRLTEELGARAAQRRVGVTYALEGGSQRCTLDPDLSERLVRRFIEGVVAVAAADETVAIMVDRERGNCAIAVTRPATLAGQPDEQLLDPAFATGEGGLLGVGFALRLVRGLARIAGGDLRIEPARLVLLVPAGTPTETRY